jgi:hypothetical protein
MYLFSISPLLPAPQMAASRMPAMSCDPVEVITRKILQHAPVMSCDLLYSLRDGSGKVCMFNLCSSSGKSGFLRILHFPRATCSPHTERDHDQKSPYCSTPVNLRNVEQWISLITPIITNHPPHASQKGIETAVYITIWLSAHPFGQLGMEVAGRHVFQLLIWVSLLPSRSFIARILESLRKNEKDKRVYVTFKSFYSKVLLAF